MKFRRRRGYDLRNNLNQFWRENKTLVIFLSIFVVAGIIIGIIVTFDPFLNHMRITRGLLDGNVANVASPGRGFFSFIFARLTDIFFGGIIIFLFSLTKWTWIFTFIYLAFRSFWMVINLWWIVDRFGFFHGAPFFIIYMLVLVTLLVFFICISIFFLKLGKQIRQYGFKSACRLPEIRRPLLMVLCFIAVLGLVEWFLNFVLLSRLIYIF
ncbi:MAG: hypothetical protein FWE01_01235 [Firmicutes bacterium]|nr:hypothetical protein [Bacillota bacterium]